MEKITNKGITLVALVITIILLLILAGITMVQLSKNRLFDKAKLAKEKTEESQNLQHNTLLSYEEEIKKITGTRDNIGEEELLARVTQTSYTDFQIQNLDSYKFFMIYLMYKDNVIKGQITISLNKLKNSNETSYIEPIFYDGGFYYALLYYDSNDIIKAMVNSNTIMEIYGVK